MTTEITTTGAWRSVLTALKTLLEGVSGLGPIYDYQPDFREPEQFKEMSVRWDPDEGAQIINAWFVERLGIEDVRGGRSPGVPLTQAVRRDRYRITGLYGYGKSGKTTYEFQELVERVMDVLLPSVTLGNSNYVTFAATATTSMREYGDYLTHAVEVELRVERRVSVVFE